MLVEEDKSDCMVSNIDDNMASEGRSELVGVAPGQRDVWVDSCQLFHHIGLLIYSSIAILTSLLAAVQSCWDGQADEVMMGAGPFWLYRGHQLGVS